VSDRSPPVFTMMNKIRTMRLRRMKYPCEDKRELARQAKQPQIEPADNKDSLMSRSRKSGIYTSSGSE